MTRAQVNRRPLKERLLIRQFGGDLFRLCNKANISPDKKGVSRFMDVWQRWGGIA